MGKKFLITISLLATLPFLANGQTSDDELRIIIDGRTRVVVTDPSGKKTGSHGFEVWQENEHAKLNLGFDSESIVYTGIPLGTYTLDFRGQPSEQFTTTIAVADGGRLNQIDFIRWSTAQTNSLMTFTLSRNEEEKLVINSPEFARPRGTARKQSDDTVHLVWDAIEDAEKYTIYSKLYDYPYFKQIGETIDTTFSTNVPWATDSGDTLRPDGKYYFTIVAHFDTGNTSVMSAYISNDDMDSDGLNDWREAELRTNPISADTDSDGLDDYLEINHYYTNPISADSDGDGFDDGEEIEQGTLPNQKESYPGRADECDAPASGDWHVSDDCDVTHDQNVQENIIVHPHALMRIRENVTVLFDYIHHSILVMFGGGIKLDSGAEIKQK